MDATGPIVLLTDFGYQDHYAGVLRGVIASIAPRCPLLDLTHGIEPQNILEGAFQLLQGYSFFPSKTIFVCVVDPGVGTRRMILCAKTKRYYFIAPDNGLLDPVLTREGDYEVRSLENPKFMKSPASSTFHGRDKMAPAAAHLAKSVRFFSQLGPRLHRIEPLAVPETIRTETAVRGEIL